MPCNNCEERWRIVLAQQSKLNYMKPSDKDDAAKEGAESTGTAPVAKAVIVPPLARPDVNKVIEDRRKVIADGKIIKK